MNMPSGNDALVVKEEVYMFRLITIITALIFSLSISATYADELKFRIAADALTDPKTALEGNVAKSILYQTDDGAFFGGTIYSAALGNAGGLFIGGFEVGQQIELGADYFAEAAVFFGGGGGAGIVGGDGMLIRPRLNIGRKFGKYEISVGASYMHVTGSNISSPVFELAIASPLDWLLADGHIDGCADCKIVALSPFVSLEQIGASYKSYIPLTNLAPGKRSGGTLKTMQLAGAGLVLNMDNMWGQGWQSFINAHGAMGGDGEGYAEIIVGGRYGFDVTDWLNIYADAGIGFAGGGDVDTGGGAVFATNIGAKWRIFGTADIEASVGYIGALGGGFHALVPAIKIGLPLGSGGQVDVNNLNASHWSITTGYSIIPEHAGMRSDGDTGVLGLTDFKGDLYLSDNFYMTGQAMSVTTGMAGGFAIGLVGGGASLPITDRISLSAELLLGAAAGGGIIVNGGLVAAAQLDVDYKLNENMSLTANAGWIKAVKGGLNGPLLGAGLKFHFTSFR
ncbi:MAG: hypothetical protein HRU29_15100 [Rhizobiales bacterium]|nr:hypothetical protein [Hyphomicrobiales bacterium]NRB15723.1 hypothetical protein [Hyphomicrobiales bacterium]